MDVWEHHRQRERGGRRVLMEGKKCAGEAEQGDSRIRRGKRETVKTEAGEGGEVGDGAESSSRRKRGRRKEGRMLGRTLGGTGQRAARSSARCVGLEC